jgi:urea transporter
LFGFNGVLCGIALSGKKWRSLILAIASIVISIFLIYGMMNLGIITLTSPFVLSTWLVLLLEKRFRDKSKG